MPVVRPALTYCYELGVRDGSSPEGSYAPDETQETRQFRVPYSERYNAVTYFTGWSQFVVDGAGMPVGLERLVGLPHPDNPLLVATKIQEMKGYKFNVRTQNAVRLPGANSWLNTHDAAELRVLYEQIPYRSLADDQIQNEMQRFTSLDSVKPSADYIMLPGGMLRYISPSGSTPPHGQVVPFNIGKVEPIIEEKVTWHRLPYIINAPDLFPNHPWLDRIYGTGPDPIPYLGSINKEPFRGYPPGMVLFSAIEFKLRTYMGQGLGWDVEFTFAIKPSKGRVAGGGTGGGNGGAGGGWNWLYHYNRAEPATNGYYFIGRDLTWYAPGAVPDNYSIYNERPFKNLWRVDAI